MGQYDNDDDFDFEDSDYADADYGDSDYGDSDYADDWLDDDAAETIPCPNCGSEIYEEAEQCPICGEYITPNTRTSQTQPRWVIVTVILLLISIALWFLGPIL